MLCRNIIARNTVRRPFTPYVTMRRTVASIGLTNDLLFITKVLLQIALRP